MRLCSIASGSSGNCIYAGTEKTSLIIDAGISGKRIVLQVVGIPACLQHMYVMIRLQQQQVQTLEPLNNAVVKFTQICHYCHGAFSLTQNISRRLRRIMGNRYWAYGHVPNCKVRIRLDFMKQVF